MAPLTRVTSTTGPPPHTPADDATRRATTISGPSSAAPSARTISAPRWSRTIGTPPRRRDRMLMWLILLALLGLACFPVLTELNRPVPRAGLEADALARGVETWRDADRRAEPPWRLSWWTPRTQGQASFAEPPGHTWLLLLAFETLETEQATPGVLRHRARWVSVAMGLMTIAAVFWCGVSIGGVMPAAMGALVLLSCPAMVLVWRWAGPQAAQIGWVTLSIAAALWAQRLLRPASSLLRQGLGWTLCGLALGMAMLTAGFIALPLVILPLLAILMLCPNRPSHLVGLIAATCLAMVVIAPWAIHIHEHEPTAWQRWIAPFAAPLERSWASHAAVVGHRLLWLLLLLAPWTLWHAASLVQPFSTSSAGIRQRMFIGWTWTICTAVVVLTEPATERTADVLYIVPPACMLMGQLFRRYADLSGEGRHARTWRVLRWLHIAMFMIVSVLLPAAMLFEDRLVAEGWLPRRLAAPMPWVFWAGLGTALVGLSGLSARFAIRHYPAKTLVCWATWVAVLVGVAAIPLARGPLGQDPQLAEPPASVDRHPARTPVEVTGAAAQRDP